MAIVKLICSDQNASDLATGALGPISHAGDVEELVGEERAIGRQTLYLEEGETNVQITQCLLILREQAMKIWELAFMIFRKTSTKMASACIVREKVTAHCHMRTLFGCVPEL